MNEFAVLPSPIAADSDADLGARAARMIWDDQSGVDDLIDPRTPDFANAVVTGLASALASSPGALKKMMRGAAAAAEDLNVEPFQGLTEVIQNADDLRAAEVRFALRDMDAGRELLIVHNGQPVACQHVLGMALPFVTTKTNKTDQRGRFGIGLKTLKRIADNLAIHSAPYHFSGDQLSVQVVPAEGPLPGFYDPVTDTMIVLRLKPDFSEEGLKAWFAEWEDDGLIFLTWVSSFRWCDLTGATMEGRTLTFGAWEDMALVGGRASITALSRREVQSTAASWTVWRATLPVPGHLHPAHKARPDVTRISIAVPSAAGAGSLYIGFKTRVSVDLSFSLDAQFDPSTTREALIESTWNNWLIERCGDVLGEIAHGRMLATPKDAWRFVPVAAEYIGNEGDRWLRGGFAKSFETVRDWLGEHAAILIGGAPVALSNIAYEYAYLSDLLTDADIEALAEGSRALPRDVRDEGGRWRTVLDQIGVCATVGTTELLEGFKQSLFQPKGPSWWVKAARLLVEIHADEELFDVPFWLTDEGRAVVCKRKGATAKPLVLGGEFSLFSLRWNLLDRLHAAYGTEKDGEVAIRWLDEHAAFRTSVDASTELAAFAERFAASPLEIEDADLRELRNRFDELSDRRADELGHAVGAALMVDGFVYKSGKMHRQKVSPTEAYLCKTLDSDFPNWPTAAENIPGIQWISAGYDEKLKTGATRAQRKRADGTISRGPRKFFALLGVENAPRLKQTGLVRWGGTTRNRELRAAQAEQVPADWISPDLDRVLAAFPKFSKKDLRERSPALFKAMARAWERSYANRKMVASQHEARVYVYPKAPVTAQWLIQLRETPWVAIGKGELVTPNEAVVKTQETQTLYASTAFAVGIDLGDFTADFAATLGLVTSVRVSDLVKLLRETRDGVEAVDDPQVMAIYRNIAKYVPRAVVWNTRIGDMTAQDLRKAFTENQGLIHVGGNVWRRPNELMRGKDIFHDRSRFVPAGPAIASLWSALDVREPTLDDCLAFLKSLAGQAYDVGVTSRLIDVYRYMEPLLANAERRHRERMKTLPLYCGDRWESERPIFLVEDSELRSQLAKALPAKKFWTPPCDLRELATFMVFTGVTRSEPALVVADDRDTARDRGDGTRAHFRQTVDHLSDELARNDPEVRQRMAISWDALREIPLFVHAGPIAVLARDEEFSAMKIPIQLQALIVRDPLELHVWDEALPKREYGGHAIASLFPHASRRGIEAEWVVAWQEARDTAAEAIRLASDEEHAEAMEDRAAKINATPKKKISVSTPGGKSPALKPRTLKNSVGPILGATVVPGSNPKPAPPPAKPKLHDTPPPTKPSDPGSRTASAAYTDRDLEQRGWELLTQALETSAEELLVDFRSRHGVGADGAIDWKTFVEMKATGRAPQSSIEMSNAEYERAKERGNDFILALVSGLEDGYQDEVRLIFDPAHRATVRPLNGVKLVALTEAPLVLIPFGNAEE
ncbi:DUF3883 domain-containing protein [Mesorhizobium sp. B3-1-3]|uniref:sacsin N-terminal ATP-binding-like domain-containing protein n=1 Tax=unclassified Mesorhizobium TaxID=325217 RepID=UPI001125BA71|nr:MULTISPECIES: DUF3883 domain-containing protein [unclassified Mesorhizobium]TPI59848.1 DUF3883 domain-containing protein [Mesorhizobium sp. B3-1-8]TPI68240.1 DUF3883 domain-containing protein [Mesorhizobium sp. B3-1-3]